MTTYWYDMAQGGSPLGSGATWSPGWVAQTDTFYASVFDGDCESSRDTFILEILPVPATPQVIDTVRCGFDGFFLSGAGSLTYHWYSDTMLTPVATGPTYMTAPILQSDTLWYAEWDGNCESPLAPILLWPLPPPALGLIMGAQTTETGDTVMYFLNPPPTISPVWQVNGGASTPVGDSIQVIWTQAGTGGVTVSLTDSNGCTSSDILAVTILQPVGFPEMGASDDISIFPNPSEGTATLVVPGLRNSIIWVVITDLVGKTVWTGQMESDGLGRCRIDPGQLADGTYFLRVLNSVGEPTLIWQIRKSR